MFVKEIKMKGFEMKGKLLSYLRTVRKPQIEETTDRTCTGHI